MDEVDFASILMFLFQNAASGITGNIAYDGLKKLALIFNKYGKKEELYKLEKAAENGEKEKVEKLIDSLDEPLRQELIKLIEKIDIKVKELNVDIKHIHSLNGDLINVKGGDSSTNIGKIEKVENFNINSKKK